MHRLLLAVVVWLAVAGPVFAQSIDVYLTPTLRTEVERLAQVPPGMRDPRQLRNLLPLANSGSFVELIKVQRAPAVQDLRRVLGDVDARRLNKMLANGPGSIGTALVSGVAAPAVIAAAVEYGSILQQTTGTTTTLRGNLLGIGRLALGNEQFPYCAEIATGECSAAVRWLRRLSGSVGFENISASESAAPGGVGQLLGDDYRVSSWGARLDVTPSNNLDDPKYIAEWRKAIDVLRAKPEAAALTKAVNDAFGSPALTDVYATWAEGTVAELQKAVPARFRDVLEERLSLLPPAMAAADPAFGEHMSTLSSAYQGYFDVRDSLIRAAHVHKLSLEYANRRLLAQPAGSSLRLIYSHQPTSAASIVTLNSAVSFTHETPAGSTAGALRDVQLAGQIDRRIGDIASLGQAVLTLAGYYQWMKEDALILVPAGTTAPGSSIELPAEAAALLGTKGHIGVVQAKLSISLTEAVKVPLSFTWASRKELVKEGQVRGQLGLTLDLDQLFH